MGIVDRAAKSGRTRRWPLLMIAAPAFVATWSGWVGLGAKAGFGPVNLLPGIGGGWTINTAITLPLGIEAYAAYALGVWLSQREMSHRTRRFAMVSGAASLLLGALGQVAYHLLEVFGQHVAPWQVVVGVACLPIGIVGMTAALLHMLRADEQTEPVAEIEDVAPVVPGPVVEPATIELAPVAPVVQITEGDKDAETKTKILAMANGGPLPTVNAIRNARLAGTGRATRLLNELKQERSA
jgi:hypothetical protein